MKMIYLYSGLVSFVMCLALTWGALKVFPRIGMMDKPHKYGLTRAPIPYAGGVIFYIVFLVVVGFFADWNLQIAGVVLGALILLIVNLIDDLKALSPWPRLMAQGLAALVVVLSGVRVDHVTNPFGGAIDLSGLDISFGVGVHLVSVSFVGLFVTVVWILAMVNTMNWLDGLNGLPSGVTVIAATTIFALAIRPDFHAIDQTQTAILAISVVGMALAFWFFDFSPAKILMGDTGSMFFGYMLAVLAILSGGKIATAFLVMGLPLIDFAWVIARRVIEGKSPFRGDLRHFHHRLVAAGISERKSLFVIYAVCAAFGATALFLGTAQKLVAVVVLGVMVAGVGVWLTWGSGRSDIVKK
ncbi:MAG: MraY family glycosyltransferase [Candidatus Gracilibacteria bacterium]